MWNGFKVIDADAHMQDRLASWVDMVEPEYYDRRPRIHVTEDQFGMGPRIADGEARRDADGAVAAVAEEGVALGEVGHGAPELDGRGRERIAVGHQAHAGGGHA